MEVSVDIPDQKWSDGSLQGDSEAYVFQSKLSGLGTPTPWAAACVSAFGR